MNNAYEVLGAAHDPYSLSQPSRPVNQGCSGRLTAQLGPISLGGRRRSATHRPQIRLPEDMP
jgi:hypothetical protein